MICREEVTAVHCRQLIVNSEHIGVIDHSGGLCARRRNNKRGNDFFFFSNNNNNKVIEKCLLNSVYKVLKERRHISVEATRRYQYLTTSRIIGRDGWSVSSLPSLFAPFFSPELCACCSHWKKKRRMWLSNNVPRWKIEEKRRILYARERKWIVKKRERKTFHPSGGCRSRWLDGMQTGTVCQQFFFFFQCLVYIVYTYSRLVYIHTHSVLFSLCTQDAHTQGLTAFCVTTKEERPGP